MTLRTQTVTLSGHTFRVHLPCDGADYYAENWRAWENGELEKALFDFISQNSDPTATFFDLGGWIGCATLVASRDYRKVVTYEAEQKSF